MRLLLVVLGLSKLPMMSYNNMERMEVKVLHAPGITCNHIFIVVGHLDISKDSRIGKTRILVGINMVNISRLMASQTRAVIKKERIVEKVYLGTWEKIKSDLEFSLMDVWKSYNNGWRMT